MTGATARGVLLLPLVKQGPIQQREKGAVVLDKGIMLKQGSDGGLVKQSRRRYHGSGLLLRVS